MAIWALADVALVTSLREGVNLGAMEFVACQQSSMHGVLIYRCVLIALFTRYLYKTSFQALGLRARPIGVDVHSSVDNLFSSSIYTTNRTASHRQSGMLGP